MISHKYKCIFIHIPKTAGTSIERKLNCSDGKRKRGSQDHRTIRNLADAIIPSKRRLLNPVAWLRCANQRYKGNNLRQEFVTKAQFDNYFKFTIVRNPWSRVYSWYKNVIRDPLHQQQLGIGSECSFYDFVSNHLDTWALRPQLSWVWDYKGNIAVDFVGMFESLEKDFSFICRELGINDDKLPQVLKSDNSDYRLAYTTETIEIVAAKYVKDIEYFGYLFE